MSNSYSNVISAPRRCSWRPLTVLIALSFALGGCTAAVPMATQAFKNPSPGQPALEAMPCSWIQQSTSAGCEPSGLTTAVEQFGQSLVHVPGH